MSFPKKIAVLVHNDVMRDARVRKQARSLVEAGHKVDIFGFSIVPNDYPDVIEGGANLHINSEKFQPLGMRIALSFRRYFKGIKRAKSNARRASSLTLLGMINVFVNTTILVYLFAPSLIPVLGLAALALGLFALFLLSLLSVAVGLYLFNATWINDWIKVNWGYGAIAKALAVNVIDGDYDVVHCHDMIAMLAGEMIKKEKPSIIMIWDAHELYTELSYKTPYMSMFTGKMIARIAPRVDKMITISQSFIDFYAKHYPKLPKAEMVMNATRRPVTERMDRTLLREAAGVNDGQKVLLFQGGVAPYRGVGMLLEAAPKLPPNWSVVFMGYGPLQDEIEEAANAANAERPEGAPCIAFIPPAPQEVLRDWTSGADLGIIPYENTSKNHLYCTPNKLWEYPNARVPILATNLVEINQIITKNGTGSLLPRDFKVDDIVNAIEAVTDAQLENWRINCDTFNAVENWEKFEPNLLKVYS